MASNPPAAACPVDVATLDPAVAQYIKDLQRERDDAAGRCQNYQIQATTMQTLVHELQTQVDKQQNHGGKPNAGQEINKAASRAIAGLKSVGMNIFKKRPNSRRNSVDTGGADLLKPADGATTVNGTGAAADAKDAGLALAVATAVATNGGVDAEGSSQKTLGYAETLEQDVKNRDSKIKLLAIEVAQLRELNQTASAELNSLRQQNSDQELVRKQLEASLNVEKTMRQAAEVEVSGLENRVKKMTEDAQEADALHDTERVRMQELEHK